jgi:acyl-CoA reductase-like NAD-dependent aldehyde dehydrogenase
MTTAQAAAPSQFSLTVDGADLPAGRSFGVINPSTGRVFAQAPAIALDQLDAVFAAAERAYQSWRRDDDARRAHLLAAAEAVAAGAEELARLLTTEQGKPLSDARNEILGASAWYRYYATLELPRELIRDDSEGYEEVFRRPLGVVSAITPWNFPIVLAVWKIAPALRAGNTIVVKPPAGRGDGIAPGAPQGELHRLDRHRQEGRRGRRR